MDVTSILAKGLPGKVVQGADHIREQILEQMHIVNVRTVTGEGVGS